MKKYSRLFFFVAIVLFMLSACTATKKTGIKNEDIYPDANPFGSAKVDTNFAYDAAQQYILGDSNFLSAHVGISIYNPETQQYLYNYQGNKYFVPASNMKLFTCYAAMKNLGDSLVGLRYSEDKNGGVTFIGTGDPTFLHPDFKNQFVYDFLKRKFSLSYLIDPDNSKFTPLGNGWAWNDYESDYMPERSEFPIYGNLVKFYRQADSLTVTPYGFYDEALRLQNIDLRAKKDLHFTIERTFENNIFRTVTQPKSKSIFSKQYIPFKTNSNSFQNPINQTFIPLLHDTLNKKISLLTSFHVRENLPNIIYSQPTDSLLKPMMSNSDNFFAEQTLLMVSNEKLGVMNDEKIIDTLLKTDFKGLPQKPKWVDGSGLSRYNLITPQDFVWVLAKMKTDFSWQRITTILATGNEGTLSNYYKNLSGKIFAKTGTLSGQVALSGYLITKQNKTLIFSVLVNNHQAAATAIRRGVEKFLNSVWEKY